MDIGSIINTSPNASHPSEEASADNTASSLWQLAEIASASTPAPSTNVHETTTATTDRPALHQDATANDALPYPGFDPDYDDERRPPREVNAGPDNGLPTPPLPQSSNIRSGPPKVKATPRTTSSTIPHLTDTTSPADPTPVINVHRTTALSSGARRPVLPGLQRGSSPASGPDIHGRASASVCDGSRNDPPPPGPTPSLNARRFETAARSSNGFPDVAEIIDVDVPVLRPNIAARDSNRTLDDVEILREIIDADASVAQPNASARSSNRIADVADNIDVDASVTRPNAVARDSNGIPDDVEIIKEIIDADTPVTRPNANVRSSNGIPDNAEFVDADVWEARRHTQVTRPSSVLSVQVRSSAPVSPVRASSPTLSVNQLEQNAVIFLASNSRIRDIRQGRSGSSTGSDAAVQDDNPFPGQENEPWYCLNIDIALKYGYDAEFGAELIRGLVNNSHKADESRKGKQREDDGPHSPLLPSIEDASSSEIESCDDECEVSDEDAANMEYIYIERAPRNGNEPLTIRAHPGDAVWALVGTRHGPVNDPRKWKRACGHCNPRSEEDREQTIPLEEDREETIPLEEAAVDDMKNRKSGAAYYNPGLYSTTSSMRETRIKPFPPKARPKDKAMSPNLSAPSPSNQAPSSRSKGKGKQKTNGNGNSNESKPTPPPASDRTTISRSIAMGLRTANDNISSDASATQARSPSHTRTSLRNRQLFGPQPLAPLPPRPLFPVTASSFVRSQRYIPSRQSQRYVPSPLGQTVDLSSNATTPEPVQVSSTDKNKDDEHGSRGGKKEKKNVNQDCKENGNANNKRKASEAIDEDADAACIRVTRRRTNIVSTSSTNYNMSGALQDTQTSASASGTLTLPAAANSRVASSSDPRSSNLPGPSNVVAEDGSPNAVGARSNVAPQRDDGEREEERQVRLRLRMAAEANPRHPGYQMYLMGRATISRKRGRE